MIQIIVCMIETVMKILNWMEKRMLKWNRVTIMGKKKIVNLTLAISEKTIINNNTIQENQSLLMLKNRKIELRD